MPSEDEITIRQVDIRPVDPRGDIARFCLQRYYEELAGAFAHGFEVARSRDPKVEQMMPPLGAFLVASAGERAVGCVGLKGDGTAVGEVKRLWVAPSARGLGLSYRLMEAVEEAARSLSISTLRLDTNRALPGALHLYRRLGWTMIERFNDDPYADFFFEKVLLRAPPPPA